MEPTFSGPIGDDEILRGVKVLKQANINTVITEGLRGIIRFEHDGKTDAVTGVIRKVAQACHREGIKVIHHTTTAFAGHNLREFPASCREWLNIDAQTGTYAYSKWCDVYLWCINNPDFRAEYFRLSKKVIRETGVDGFMTDEVYFRTGWHNCACPHCREKYRKTSGFILPDGAADYFWGRLDNPAFRAWIRFRCASVGDFYADLYAALRKEHPHPVLLGCENAAVSPLGSQGYGDSNEERMRGVNLLFTETGSELLLYHWRGQSFNFMAYGGLSNYYGTPTMAIMYPPNINENFLSWALRVAHGVRMWATSGGGELCRHGQLLTAPEDLALFGELFGWEEKHKRELVGMIRPLANIGVLLSAATRDMSDHSRGGHYYIPELVGWSEALTDEYIQYAVMREQELTLSHLRQYALVILPNAACLSDTACQTLLEYVDGGGNVILTHETGLFDETGLKKTAEHRLENLGINWDTARDEYSSSRQPSRNVQYGEYGRGKWVYFMHRPGFSVGQLPYRGAKEFPAVPEEEQKLQRALIIEAVLWAVGNEFPVTVKEAPDGLLIKAFQHQDSKRQAIVVHLLNCRGAEPVKFGEVIPEKYPVKFPSLEKDIILELRLDSIKQVYLISPDWPGKKPVKVNPVNNGYRLIIPADTLKRYEVLCLAYNN